MMMENKIEISSLSKDSSLQNKEGLSFISQLLQEFAEIEYQYFLEKNEKTDAAKDDENREIGQNQNQKTAA